MSLCGTGNKGSEHSWDTKSVASAVIRIVGFGLVPPACKGQYPRLSGPDCFEADTYSPCLLPAVLRRRVLVRTHLEPAKPLSLLPSRRLHPVDAHNLYPLPAGDMAHVISWRRPAALLSCLHSLCSTHPRCACSEEARARVSSPREPENVDTSKPVQPKSAVGGEARPAQASAGAGRGPAARSRAPAAAGKASAAAGKAPAAAPDAGEKTRQCYAGQQLMWAAMMKQLSSSCGVPEACSTCCCCAPHIAAGSCIMRWPCVGYDSACCGLQASSLLLSSRPQQQPPAASLCRPHPHLAMASLQLHSPLHLATASLPRAASLQLHSPLHLATAREPRVASLQLLPREPVQRLSRPLAL